MGSMFDLYIERADNELLLSKVSFEISTSASLKQILKIEENRTFFNDVISQAYYSIFYAAKAFLLFNKKETKPPEEHRKTYEEFKLLVDSGKVDKMLLQIYEEETIKAESLLNILFIEKRKRGTFTYNMNANANKPHAEESLKNAKTFVSMIASLIKN